jgi:uncharacterized protein (DUF362 family)
MESKRWTPKRLAAESIDVGRRFVCRLLALSGLGLAFGCSAGSSTPPPDGGSDPPPEDPPPEEPPPEEPPPEEPPPPEPSAGPRVVHVHAPDATDWSGQTDFWNHVDASVVDRMVDEGIQALTGETTVKAAWQTLLPDYVPGEVVAIKVNLNNSSTCYTFGPEIDALMQPVNAVVRGLKEIGVAESDIAVYDASRSIPDRFRSASLYPGLRFVDTSGCNENVKFSSTDPDAIVSFSPPAGIPKPSTIRLADVLVNATYLINMPILKVHQAAGVTLGFKNHLGTTQQPGLLHDYADLGTSYTTGDYSALVDLFRSPHISGKTVLTVGDGLFGTLGGCCSAPTTWKTFGDRVPNSIFLSTDPVAIDCVMHDFLAAEKGLLPGADDYLKLAGAAGLGTYEQGDPWGAGYDAIDYVRIDV